MDIYDYLRENCVKTDVEAATMYDAIDILADLHLKAGNISDKEAFKKDVLCREKEAATALFGDTALPHAKSSAVLRPALAKITLKTPVLWGGKSVSTVYMLASDSDEAHIRMLSSLASSLQNNDDNI